MVSETNILVSETIIFIAKTNRTTKIVDKAGAPTFIKADAPALLV